MQPLFSNSFYDSVPYLCLTENIDINRHEGHADRNMNMFKKTWQIYEWQIHMSYQETTIYGVESNDPPL